MLTKQQESLKVTDEQNILCLASAGSGKSFTLVHRITHLINDKKVKPEDIYLFSFSRTATQEIREKLAEALGKHILQRMYISTFHAYAYKIVMEQAKVLKLNKDTMSIIGSNQLEALLKYTGKRMIEKGEIYQSLGRADLQQILAVYTKARHFNDYSGLASYQKYVLKDVIEYMERKQTYTFDDLLELVKNLFYKHPIHATYYANQFKYLILDEAQDTSSYVFEILRLLLNDTHHFTAVGDIQQNLYGFTGCDPDNLISFAKDRNCKIMQLNQTFRFGETICDLANEVVKDLDIEDEYKINTETVQVSKNPVYIHVEDRNDALKSGVEAIEKWISEGVELKDIYVLARTNRELQEYMNELLKKEIPATNRGESFLKRKEIEFILSALAILKNNNREDWLLFVKPLPVGINTKIVNLAFADFEGSLEELKDRINNKSILGIGAKRKKEFNQLFETLYYLAKALENNLRDFKEIGKLLGIKDTDFMSTAQTTAEGTSIQDERWEYLEVLTQMSKEYRGSILTFPEYLKTYFDVDSSNDQNAVTLLTIHKSKGMTLPYVVLDTKKFFSFANSAKEELWEKFCLYVGITRAKHELYYLFKPDNPCINYVPDEVAELVIPEEMLESRKEKPTKKEPETQQDILLKLAGLVTGSNHTVELKVNTILQSTDKAIHLESNGLKHWIPKSAMSVSVAKEKIFIATWYAQSKGLY